MSRHIRVDLIDPSPWADLFPHDEEHIARLADDVAARGVQTPLHVYRRGERYELLAGHDRLEAARRCGLAEVPAEERPAFTSEDQRFEHFLKDNVLRKATDARRVATEAIRRWPDLPLRQIADRSGVSPQTIMRVRAEMEERGDVFPRNTVRDAAGREQPAHKPRVPTEAQVEAVRERKAEKDAAPEETQAPAGGAVVEPAPEDERTSVVVSAPAPAAPQPPAPTRSDRVPQRRPVPARLRDFVAAALSASDVTDEEIAAMETNDMMVAGLAKAREVADRIIRRHEQPGRKHA